MANYVPVLVRLYGVLLLCFLSVAVACSTQPAAPTPYALGAPSPVPGVINAAAPIPGATLLPVAATPAAPMAPAAPALPPTSGWNEIQIARARIALRVPPRCTLDDEEWDENGLFTVETDLERDVSFDFLKIAGAGNGNAAIAEAREDLAHVPGARVTLSTPSAIVAETSLPDGSSCCMALACTSVNTFTLCGSAGDLETPATSEDECTRPAECAQLLASVASVRAVP